MAIPTLKGGFNTFLADTHTALGHMVGAMKAGAWSMIRGKGLQGLTGYAGPSLSEAKAGYRKGYREAYNRAMHVKGIHPVVINPFSGERVYKMTSPMAKRIARKQMLEGGQYSALHQALNPYRTAAGRHDLQLKQIGMYGAGVVGAGLAINALGGDDVLETAGGVGGFALGYSRYAGRGRLGGGFRGIGAGVLGGAIGRWIL